MESLLIFLSLSLVFGHLVCLLLLPAAQAVTSQDPEQWQLPTLTECKFSNICHNSQYIYWYCVIPVIFFMKLMKKITTKYNCITTRFFFKFGSSPVHLSGHKITPRPVNQQLTKNRQSHRDTIKGWRKERQKFLIKNRKYVNFKWKCRRRRHSGSILRYRGPICHGWLQWRLPCTKKIVYFQSASNFCNMFSSGRSLTFLSFCIKLNKQVFRSLSFHHSSNSSHSRK